MSDYSRLNIYFKRLGQKNLLGRMPLPSKFNREMPNTYLLTSRIAASHLEEYDRILVVGIPGLKSNQPHLSLYYDDWYILILFSVLYVTLSINFME